MKNLFYIVQKEFLQIFRNKEILRAIFVMPMMQLILLPLAADYSVKNISLAVIDHDHSTYSQRLIQKLKSSGYFKITVYAQTYQQGLSAIGQDQADLVIEIPNHFEQNLIRENQSETFVAINAINGIKAGLGGSYIGAMIRDFNNEIRQEWFSSARFNTIPLIEVTYSDWYNRYLNYKLFMVPPIMVTLLTMVGVFLTTANIVKEKEMGTIEQINVTPIHKYEFIAGKLIPFWVIGLVMLTIGLFISWLIYGIIPVGSYVLIYVMASIFLVAVLGLGLLISTVSDTQQQAMFVSFFFMMIFMMMAGTFTSLDAMPEWARTFTRFVNPVSYFVEAIRMIVLKGSTFYDLIPHFKALGIFAVVLNILALLSYRKTV